MDLVRSTGPFDTNPNEWLPVKRPGSTDTATVTCGKGHNGLIDEHEISDDGTVTPSVVCTEDGCGWHENIALVGWPER